LQINVAQADALYALVLEAADLRPSDAALDLYCGAGTLTLLLAARCARAVGVEASPGAVADARANAERAGAANATFVVGRVETAKLADELDKAAPDVVVADPARAGLAPGAVDFLRRCPARRLVYVSCNPATQARDVARLTAPPEARGERPWRLLSATPVDMFPQTSHIEVVCVLERA
jgi:23S rRNA (uracil1939-C5)-methyltransferase